MSFFEIVAHSVLTDALLQSGAARRDKTIYHLRFTIYRAFVDLRFTIYGSSESNNSRNHPGKLNQREQTADT